MVMTVSECEALLARWIKPSSDSEQDRQERAERMIRDAIDASDAFKASDYRIYAKGSYRNNTNVRLDSDVDVVVELVECVYYDYFPGVSPSPQLPPYGGDWTRESWRAAVLNAMEDYFGSSEVDSSDKIAIEIQEKIGSRPNADVIPSFKYIRYDTSDQSVSKVGSCVFTRDKLEQIINWPQQQYDNGVAKNSSTNGRYKKFVRALKNAENVLVADGVISDLPSYFMECLVYNVPDDDLKHGANLSDGFKQALAVMYRDLDLALTDATSAYQTWLEPNRLKWLFKGNLKWSVTNGKQLVQETWTYLGYSG